jgi:hypothetical protein
MFGVQVAVRPDDDAVQVAEATPQVRRDIVQETAAAHRRAAAPRHQPMSLP